MINLFKLRYTPIKQKKMSWNKSSRIFLEFTDNERIYVLGCEDYQMIRSVNDTFIVALIVYSDYIYPNYQGFILYLLRDNCRNLLFKHATVADYNYNHITLIFNQCEEL